MWGHKRNWWLKYITTSSPNVKNWVILGPEFGRCHLQNNNCLSEAGIPMLRMNWIMVSNQIHYISMSYNYTKCIHEQYTSYLHLKISRRYTSSICIFKKLVTPTTGDENFIARETTSRYSKLRYKYNGSVRLTTPRSSTSHWENNEGSRWSGVKNQISI